MIRASQVCDSLEVRLPIANVLVIKAVNDVFAQEQVWELRAGLVREQVRWDQICLLNRGIVVAAPNCAQYLFAQPGQIFLEFRQHGWRLEILGKRLVAMQQILRALLDDDIDRVEQPLEIAFLEERCPEVRHDEIPYEQHSQVRQFDKHRVPRLTSLYGNKPDTRSTHLHLGGTINGDVRLEGTHVIRIKTLPEELLRELSGRIEFERQLFLVVAPGIETQFRLQFPEVSVPATLVQ